MIIDSREALRSFQREAGRQADFYHARGHDLTHVWADIEAHLNVALAEGKSITLLITTGESNPFPISIKHGEQVQQLPNVLTTKA